jgi:hypothetical protein
MARPLLALACLALLLAALWLLRSAPSGAGLHADAAMPSLAAPSDPPELRDVGAQLLSDDAAPHPALDEPPRVAASASDASARRPLTVAVFDGVDGRHLGGVEVWRSDAPLRRESGRVQRVRFGGGPPPAGPSGSDERLLAGLASPFELDLGERMPAALWIVVDGYLPFRFVRPQQPSGDELWVHLERASGLEVRLIGAHVDPLARVRLYGPRQAEPAGDWRVERPAERLVRFTALEPGTWCAALEQRVGERDRWAILGQARAELAPGAWSTLVLDALAPETALEPAILTLRFPTAWVAEPGGSARLIADPGNAARYGVDQRCGPPLEPNWGPIGLVPGRYTLELEPGQVQLPIELGPGERRELHVPEIRWCDVTIRITDADGLSLEFDWLGWRSTLSWDGSPAGGRLSLPRAQRSWDPPSLRAAAAPLELTGMNRLMGRVRRIVVDPCSARELDVRLPRETLVELALEGLEGDLDLDWLLRVHLELDGAALEDAGLYVAIDGERTVATIALERAGTLDLEFPPLASHGSLRPRRVSLREGETARVTLGPEDLLSAARGR